MIKKIAWNTFKNTGDVNTFLELKQIQNIEEQLDSKLQQIQVEQPIEHYMKQQMEEQNGDNQNKWNNNI